MQLVRRDAPQAGQESDVSSTDRKQDGQAAIEPLTYLADGNETCLLTTLGAYSLRFLMSNDWPNDRCVCFAAATDYDDPLANLLASTAPAR